MENKDKLIAHESLQAIKKELDSQVEFVSTLKLNLEQDHNLVSALEHLIAARRILHGLDQTLDVVSD